MPVTVPIPWLMDSVVAPDTDQESVLDVPDTIEPGAAVKEEIVGTAPELTVTVTRAVLDPMSSSPSGCRWWCSSGTPPSNFL